MYSFTYPQLKQEQKCVRVCSVGTDPLESERLQPHNFTERPDVSIMFLCLCHVLIWGTL